MTVASDHRSAEFLKIADQFKLGALVTEASHPVTACLSDVAQHDVAAALEQLFAVDDDVIRKYREFAESGQPVKIASAVRSALQRGGRIFFTGCGSTGRLSIQLVSIWRDFWRQATNSSPGVSGAVLDAIAEDMEHRAFAVMAGGDYALIKAVEGFEDFTAFGKRQIADLGVRAGDVVFAITEGGETSFVIGTAWQGVEAGAKVYFVYNNPDDILCRHVQRSCEVIEDPRIEKINLTTGPMAITGSTRMQATTIQLCAMLTVLEMVVQDLSSDREPRAASLCNHHTAPTARVGACDTGDVPARFLSILTALHAQLRSPKLKGQLAKLVELEEGVYRTGRKNNYFADHFGIDVLTDTTERSPTFCTPPFRKFDDAMATESWAFLFVPQSETPDAWEQIIKRRPRCIEWRVDDVRGLVPEDKFARTVETIGKIGYAELMRFRVGLDGLPSRPPMPGNSAVAIVGEVEKETLLAADGYVRRQLESAHAAGAKTGLVFIGREAACAEVDKFMAGWIPECTAVLLTVPEAGFLLDGVTRAGLKMLLNALSTCTMVRLGRVMGNTMIWVVPSNLKLIDRATRYIQRLANLEYPAANRLLFEVIEYIEPRMKSDQGYPPAVGLSVLRARHGLTNEEAERRMIMPVSIKSPAPEITCTMLPAFDETNLECVREAFATAMPCLLGQGWLDQNEAAFNPAVVRTGWRDGSLFVFAEMTDRDIFNRATCLNQRTWELGDAFEMFLQTAGHERYVELQVTPENQRLQLVYQDTAAFERVRASASLDEALVPGEAFCSRTWVEPQNHRWLVLAVVPAPLVSGSDTLILGSRWHFSYSRYDYTRGRTRPVISSTSPHAEPNFHRQQEWGVMIFANPTAV